MYFAVFLPGKPTVWLKTANFTGRLKNGCCQVIRFHTVKTEKLLHPERFAAVFWSVFCQPK
jgi:hypothetical protein